MPPQIVTATADAVAQEALELVFLATPAEVSLELAPAMLQKGIRVVDLSGAFRLRDAETYARWYGATHTAAALLKDAVYGLPEFYRERIPDAQYPINVRSQPRPSCVRALPHATRLPEACGPRVFPIWRSPPKA